MYWSQNSPWMFFVISFIGGIRGVCILAYRPSRSCYWLLSPLFDGLLAGFLKVKSMDSFFVVVVTHNKSTLRNCRNRASQGQASDYIRLRKNLARMSTMKPLLKAQCVVFRRTGLVDMGFFLNIFTWVCHHLK